MDYRSRRHFECRNIETRNNPDVSKLEATPAISPWPKTHSEARITLYGQIIGRIDSYLGQIMPVRAFLVFCLLSSRRRRTVPVPTFVALC